MRLTMHLTMLVSAAVIGAAFLAWGEPEPVAEATWLDLEAKERPPPERPPPRLMGSGGARFLGAALRDREADALFEELFSTFLSQRPRKPKRFLDRLRAVGPRMYPTLLRQLPRPLKRPHAALRHGAARVILLEAGPEAAPALLDAVDGVNRSVATAAAIALYELSRDDHACLPVLLEYLRKPRTWYGDDAGAALRTIDAMGRKARRAIPVLTKLVGVRHPVRRYTGRARKLKIFHKVAVGTYAREIIEDLGANAD